MAKQDPSEQEKIPDDLPYVLLLGAPYVFKAYEAQFSEKFHFLKPWESPIPLHQFLSTHAGAVQAVFCSMACPITADILQNLPELRFIMASSAGVNHIDLHECKHRGVKVANAGSIFSEDVADMAVGLLLDVLRRVSAANRFIKAGLWPQKGDYPLGRKVFFLFSSSTSSSSPQVGGKRVGIVGMGNVGLDVAKRLHAFGCSISYTSRHKKPHVKFPFYPSINELAANCQILIVCCALTDQTHHMIDRTIMLALGKEGIIVNVARGSIIKENELVQCLLKGEIAGAGLDVYEHEPNVPQELLELDNVAMTPHHGVMTEESSRNLFELVFRNLDAFFSKKPLMFEVVQV